MGVPLNQKRTNFDYFQLTDLYHSLNAPVSAYRDLASPRTETSLKSFPLFGLFMQNVLSAGRTVLLDLNTLLMQLFVLARTIIRCFTRRTLELDHVVLRHK